MWTVIIVNQSTLHGKTGVLINSVSRGKLSTGRPEPWACVSNLINWCYRRYLNQYSQNSISLKLKGGIQAQIPKSTKKVLSRWQSSMENNHTPGRQKPRNPPREMCVCVSVCWLFVVGRWTCWRKLVQRHQCVSQLPLSVIFRWKSITLSKVVHTWVIVKSSNYFEWSSYPKHWNTLNILSTWPTDRWTIMPMATHCFLDHNAEYAVPSPAIDQQQEFRPCRQKAATSTQGANQLVDASCS